MTTPAIIFIYIFLAFFGTSVGSLPFIYLPEILPDAGISICNICTWISNLIVVFSFPILSSPDSLQMYGVFYIFGGITLLSFIFYLFYAPETKGKTKSEIQDFFKIVKSKRGKSSGPNRLGLDDTPDPK